MKTLDEVIKVLGDAPLGELSEVEIDYATVKDALHYLRELRDMTDIPMEYFESGGTSQELRNTSQITCPKCHSEFVILDDPDGGHQQLEKCRALLQDFYRNDPLTWDELRTMEGKPVWIEVDYHNPEATYKYWTIVKYFDSHEGGDMVFTGTGFYYKDLLGVDWQAYRKERE